MPIIDNIIKIMNEKGISAYKLEKDIGINAATFTHWKNGTQPAADKLEKIISYLKISPNQLFGYETEAELTENEKELLEYFRKLPDREQIKFIARVEDAAAKYPSNDQSRKDAI